jgi:hypothetical protein
MTAKEWAEMLYEFSPEFANDVYFELEDIFIKKPSWHTELTKVVHNWVNPDEKFYGYGTIEDAGDGSGDGILTFPDGLCDDLGWKEGDTLNLEVYDAENIHITKKT